MHFIVIASYDNNRFISPTIAGKTMSLELPLQLDNKPEVKELYKALKSLTDWKRFAINLQGIESFHIQEINGNERKITDCKNDLYMKWLQVCPDAKWSDVVTALRAIDEHALADTLTGSTGGTSHTHSTTDTPIEKGVTRVTHPTGIDSCYGITQQLQTTGNTSQTITIQPTVMTETILNFPAISETEMVEQLNELYKSFTLLLQDVHTQIETIQLDKLHQIAVNIEDADLDDSLANISRCKSIEDMWQRIRRVSNFLDGSILHDIVELGLHDKAFVSRAKEHMRKTNILRSQAPLRILRDRINDEKSQSNSQTTIIIQMNEAWGRLQLNRVTQLVTHICSIENEKMMFIKVRSGSIIKTLQVKKNIQLTESKQQNTQFMQLTGVFRLEIGEETIFQEDENDSYTFEQGLLEASVTGHLQAVQFILCLQVNTDYKDNEGTTPLILASQHGHIEIVTALLSAGANVNIQDNNGLTAVMLAKTVDIYQTLVQANADTTIVTHKGSTPLYISCFVGNHEVANYLLFTLKEDITTRPDGLTLLIAASQRGNYKIVEYLLDKRHDPNIQESDGRTAIQLTCLYGHYTVTELLLKHNADPNIPTNDGWTPLIVASQEGHLKIVQLLLKHGIHPNTANTKNGKTALIQASKNGHYGTAELLLINGADPNIQDSDGRTAIEQACLKGHYTVTELLLKHNAKTNIPDDDGWTPLMCASQEGYYKIIELLTQRDSDLTAVNLKNCMTALIVASKNGHLETVRILLKLWNNPNKQSAITGVTALHFATRNNHYTVVQLLLDNSADPNIPDYEGHTPLMIASQKGHYNIAKLLLHNDANPNCANFNTGTVPLIYATENNHHTIVQELLDYGADHNIQNNDGRTALELASLYGYYQIVQLLLNIDHTDTNLHTKEGWTPLLAASQEGQHKIVELLLQKGADLNARNKYNAW